MKRTLVARQTSVSPASASRRIKGGKIGDSRKPAKKVQCKDHGLDMRFDPIIGRWECPDEDCHLFAYPKDEAGGKRPQGFEGEFELMVVIDRKSGDEKFVIRQDKVFFDITQHVGQHLTNDSGYLVTLVFEDATRIDQDGNPL